MQDLFFTSGALLVLLTALIALIRTARRLVGVQETQNQILLFDRRFALYQAARNLIDALLLHKTLPDESIPHYKAAIAAAPFLIPEGLSRDLDELAKCAQSIQKLREELAPTTLDTNERISIASRLSAETTWIGTMASALDSRFAAYLRV